MKSLNRVEVSTSALKNNFSVCREHAGNADILAMVKADAYGHGMLDCSAIFVEQGAKALGVAEVAEGLALREAGFSLPVYILAGIIPQTASAAIEHRLTPVLTDGEAVDQLDIAAAQRGKSVGVHIKMDAGMGRQGTLPCDMADLIQQIEKKKNLFVQGVLAHFPMADDRSSSNSSEVLQNFVATIEKLHSHIAQPFSLHIANSGGLLYHQGTTFDMVRPGISLYGYYPDGTKGEKKTTGRKLTPAMSFKTQVIQVRQVPEGTGLGYGHSFVTTRPTTLAVLPVGYEDGFLRSLSNNAEVIIKGKKVPVVGRVSMNLSLVDCTDLEGITVGDEAILLGRQGNEEITADDIADRMGTISYEVLCLFGRMNDRVLVG